MTETPAEHKKPLFTILAYGTALIAVILMTTLDTSSDGPKGYGPGSLATSFMIALLLSGLITGQIGLIRGEKPRVLPILALLLNGSIFVAALILFPR
jgi:hypothetical protein